MMELTVKQCADSLHVSVEEILRAAKKNGILINGPNDLLSLSQVAMIEQAVLSTILLKFTIVTNIRFLRRLIV